MPKSVNQQASASKPGLSGKDRNNNWINLKELGEQEDFIDNDQVEVTQGRDETYSDRKLHDAIVMSLKRNPETDVSKVSVRVNDRYVFLEGFVSGLKAKRAIEAIVRNVPGVKEVINVLNDTNN